MANDIGAEHLFIYTDKFSTYKLAPDHPFDPVRSKLAYLLLQASGCLEASQVAAPTAASIEELLLAHDQDFVAVVQRGVQNAKADALPYGLGTEDTPLFAGMHASAALVAGATLTGLKHVLAHTGAHAFNPAGGLHHAGARKASGFCVYNDINIAIAYLRQHYDFKVLYVDTDAHHGDGVQWHFYDDPSVCTLSIHETGRYLFPGTGTVRERGSDKGYGFTFNVPLDAFSEDDSFQFVYQNALLSIANYFQPDIIISQHGVDAHFLDPMSHLSLTMDSYRYIPKLLHQVAHQYCQGRWLAVGGGGYNVFSVVPRAWAWVWLEMNGCQALAQGQLPQAWVDLVAREYGKKIASTWDDEMKNYKNIPRRAEITDKNKKNLIAALHAITQGEIGNDYLAKLSQRNEL
ncbi:MAG: acetoin utilization protein AcuC [Firmicutes bacterium]|nr:acetoin utilization protein AcuC [Bacillota bacterium]